MRIAIVTEDNRNTPRWREEPEPLFGTAPTALLEGLAALPECEVHVLSCSQKPMRSPKKLAGNIYYHSLPVRKWGWLRGAYAGCVHAVRKKTRQLQPDLVHGQGTERYCAFAAVHSGFSNVVTIHGNMRELAKVNGARLGSFGWLTARLERWTLPRTAGIFCNSLYTQALVADLARATWLVPNPVRKAFLSAPPDGSKDEVPILLNVGEISPRKRQVELLDLAVRLRRRGAAFELDFVGFLDERSAYGAQFQRQVRQAQEEGYVRYLGCKTESELVALMDKAAGLIHFPKEEAFGLVVAEGLARNLKLFGSKVGGLLDIAEGTAGAELFERDQWTELEEAIFKWLSFGHPQPTQAAQQMRERYHPEKIARRHLEVYREVLNTRS